MSNSRRGGPRDVQEVGDASTSVHLHYSTGGQHRRTAQETGGQHRNKTLDRVMVVSQNPIMFVQLGAGTIHLDSILATRRCALPKPFNNAVTWYVCSPAKS